MNNKISANEYLNNKNLLEISYIPYEQKIDICDVIMSQLIIDVGYPIIDSCMLERISTQVFIENVTNLDLSIIDDNGLNGYDTLCYYDELNALLRTTTEFEILKHMIELKYNDFKINQGSFKGMIHTLKEKFIKIIISNYENINTLFSSIDSQKASEKIANFVNKNFSRDE